MVKVLRSGHQVAVTHRNGPQVGDILLANEMAKSVLPLMHDICRAESQGMIGYMLQRSLSNEVKEAGMEFRIAMIVTQTVVVPWDSAFSEPSKPIGGFYTAVEAESCVLVAPEVFTLDESEPGDRRKGSESPGVRNVEAKSVESERIARAAMSCPYRAISVRDAETGEQHCPWRR